MSPSPYQDIRFEVADGVATITLDRPDKLNAWTHPMGASVERAVQSAVADPSARVIVITGAGRGFCAGADMAVLHDIGADRQARQRRDAPNVSGNASDAAPAAPGSAASAAAGGALEVAPHYRSRFGYLLAAPKPVIAAINGACVGLGLVLAMYCDLRFASADATLTTAFAQRGLIAEHGLAWLLPRLIGPAQALDLLLSARKFDGREAERLGLVNRAFAPETFMQQVTAYTRQLTDTVSPRSMAVIKAQVLAAPFQDFNTSLAAADAAMLDSFASEDFCEGVAHFLERRAPRFTGR